MRLPAAVLAVLALSVCGPASGAAAADPEDVRSLDGILRAYYEVVSGPAGERPDVARDRSLHHPDAWIAIAGEDDRGRPFVRRMDLDGYHGDGGPRAAPFYERELGRTVQRSGNLAHVWSRYGIASQPDGPPEQTGVNSITLFHDGERWWILGWSFDAAVH